MLQLPKKKSDSGPAVPLWHPDLRIVERLPDTKVVRTAFFTNGLAILAAVLLLLYFLHDRWELHSLNGQIADTEHMIQRDKTPSAQAVALWGKFKDEQSKQAMVSDFIGARPTVSPIILHIADTLPAKLELTNLDLGDKGVTLKGVIRGAPDQAAGDGSAYLDQLSKDKYLLGFFEDISLTSLNKDSGSGRLHFEMYLRFKGATLKR